MAWTRLTPWRAVLITMALGIPESHLALTFECRHLKIAATGLIGQGLQRSQKSSAKMLAESFVCNNIFLTP